MMGPEFGKTLPEMKAESPFPWKVVEAGMGNLVVADANNVQVPLLRVLSFVTNVTGQLRMQDDRAAAARAATEATV